MRALIERLIEVEELARRTYLAAARSYVGEGFVFDFLMARARDEEGHRLTLSHARAVVDDLAEVAERPEVAIDPATGRRAAAALLGIQARLAAAERPAPATLARMVEEAEASEWNDLFVYVMELLQSRDGEFGAAAADMPRHRAAVDDFVRRVSGTAPGVRLPREPPGDPRPTVLVVEDEEAMAKLLDAVFRSEYDVVRAADGREALERLARRRFDAVVSDFDLPGLNGADLLAQASAMEPAVKDRFLFHTALAGREPALAAAGVPVLPKPSSIQQLRWAVRRVVERSRGEGRQAANRREVAPP